MRRWKSDCGSLSVLWSGALPHGSGETSEKTLAEQSCDFLLFYHLPPFLSTPPPPTSNKLFWSLIALAPHSYDYKTGRMKKMKNREKCEKCEDFIHWDNHLIFLPYDFLALLPFCLLPFNPFPSECPDSPLQAKFAPKQQCGSSPPSSSLPTSSPSVETKFETCTAKRHVRPPW